MYLCKLKFFILSGSREPEKILRSLSLPEDCEIEVSSLMEINESKLPSFDCALISDGDLTALANASAATGLKSVLLAEGSELKDVSADLLDGADDIFVMPDGMRYDPALLTAHFRRLVNTMKNESDARKARIYFETSIDSIPDLVWFKDSVGAHLIVNDSFCKLVEKTKEQIYKRGHYYIWDIPREEYEKGEFVCLESEDVVMEARKTCVFDEKIKTKGGMRQFKTYKSPLIDIDGSIFGTCGVAHDVTDLHNMNNELNVIIENMPFAVIVSDNNDVIVNANREFDRMFGIDDELTGMTLNDWKQRYAKGKVKWLQEKDEFQLETNIGTRTINYEKQAITDIFGETIGNMTILRDVTIQRLNEQRTIKNANTDFLTGLNNRRSLSDHLDQVKDSPRLTFISIDLDNFKEVNDVYGHHMGDEALLTAARVMNEHFPDDFIARLGGDEFLVVISRSIDVEQVKGEVTEFQRKLGSEYMKYEELSRLTTSIGIAASALADCGRYDLGGILRRSDSALYKAKNNGKAQYCIDE